jgi:methionyl-tRNA formyltransferase
MRLMFMGMGGPLSSVPLQHLLQGGYPIGAVIIAAPRPGGKWRALPRPEKRGRSLSPEQSATNSPSIVQLAWDYEIPLFEVGDMGAVASQAALRDQAPDAVLVSCFAYRIPQTALDVPQHGFLNLHPSLLPEYRGPYPLFWQLRDGLGEIGLTVHRMDERLDEGPIALQTTVALETGMRGAEIERRAGGEGGKLFARALEALSWGTLTFQAQEGRGSYQGRPQPSDFKLNRSWTARRAFNFMRGTATWGQPYTVSTGDRLWRLRQAIGYEPHGCQAQPVMEDEDGVSVQFHPGILQAISAG